MLKIVLIDPTSMHGSRFERYLVHYHVVTVLNVLIGKISTGVSVNIS